MNNKYKIAFIQEGNQTQHGVMSLSAFLKQHDFETAVFISQVEKENIVKNVVEYQPDMIAGSLTTPEHKKIMTIIKELKKKLPNSFIVIGGPHPTMAPTIIERENHIEAICRGEGEEPLLELAVSLMEGKLNPNIKNMWIRNGNEIVKNENRPYIANLDALPFPDRDIYFERYPELAERDIKFMTGRGCPFNCSYCHNKTMRTMQDGQWVRFNSADRVIEDIKRVKRKYPIKWVYFIDDTFNSNKKNLKSLLDKYKKEIKIPFLCLIRVNLATEEQIDMIKEAGVDKITIGIEHGNEEFRKNILNRNMSNQEIINCVKWIKKNKIRLYTNIIMGFPEETLDMAFESIEINAKIKPELVNVGLLNPYPGTDIYERAVKDGYLPEKFDYNDLSGHISWNKIDGKVKSEIKNEYISQLINLRCFVMTLVRHYWLKPVVKQLIKLPNNSLYEFVFKLDKFKISWRYANWKQRKSLIKSMVGMSI